ncbi:MAG: PPC domain-containing protein [Planctomycetaceae bacterium]
MSLAKSASVCFVFGLLLSVNLQLRAAAPSVTSIYPAGVQRGQTVRATLSGNFPQWPVTVVSSTPTLQISPGKDKGQIEITAAATGSEGLHFLRVVDDGGASAPFAFVVGTVAETLEVEPNNSPQAAKLMELPAVVNGKLQSGGDSDAFRVKLSTNESIVAMLDARCYLGSPLDAVLQICDDQGFVLVQSHDARGLDPIVSFVAPKDGEYLVRTFGFDSEPNASIALSGNPNMVYRLTVSKGPVADFAWPIAMPLSGGTFEHIARNLAKDSQAPRQTLPAITMPWGQGLPRSHLFLSTEQELGVMRLPLHPFPCITAEQAQGELTVPISISGRFQSATDKQSYRIKAPAKSKLNIKAIAAQEEFQSDPFVSVHTSADQKLAEQDDASDKRDCELTVAVPDDGIVVIRVHDFLSEFGFRHAYELQVVPQVPLFLATTTISSIDASPDKPAIIPVAIGRIEGFAGEVEVVAANLPEGWSALPVVSTQGNKDTATEVKLTLTPTAEAKPGFIRILARVKDQPATESEVVFYQTLGAVKLSFAEVYLAVTKPAK